MSKKAIHWSGVFPAVSTQFRSDYSLDLDATHAVMKNLVKDGVSGLVVCGSVGENTSLSTDEKLQIIEVAKDAAGGKIPVIAGVAEVHHRLCPENGERGGARRRRRDHGDAGAGLLLKNRMKPRPTSAAWRALPTCRLWCITTRRFTKTT